MAVEKTDKKGKMEVWGERLKKIFSPQIWRSYVKKQISFPERRSYVVCHTDHDRERRRTDRSVG